ncbi:Hsp20/alpha crystallin family protein [Desulfurispira natronophila]|uniref:HSP20 family protein n=1 Tax=Desulfurispira natronophila TaxID=682562 RepID=A0A7W7Y4Z6_9BACT|nr:Hsp20/alpha crystallin family protein [Desulfurispira natronophila]MBB5022029.1 HSP20 family protein [Desulfurispira natronophila]
MNVPQYHMFLGADNDPDEPLLSLGQAGHPPMDIFEAEDYYRIELELPGGLDRTQLSLRYTGRNLSIHGNLPACRLPQGAKFVQMERRTGNFTRVIHLNCPVDAQAITTTYENGILTVKIPKQDTIEIYLEEHYARR